MYNIIYNELFESEGMKMKLTRISKVESGQDIAIFGGYLFDFVAHGVCLGEVSVYTMEQLKNSGGEEPEPICRFILTRISWAVGTL